MGVLCGFHRTLISPFPICSTCTWRGTPFFGAVIATFGALDECARVKNAETPTITNTTPMVKLRTKWFRDVSRLWHPAIAMFDGLAIDVASAGISGWDVGKVT
jgi:hypothetical protein